MSKRGHDTGKRLKTKRRARKEKAKREREEYFRKLEEKSKKI